VSAQSVRERLIEAGVERRPAGTHRRPPPRPNERRAAPPRRGPKRRAVEEFLKCPEARGMTQQEIADACGVKQGFVSRVAKRSGVSQRRTGRPTREVETGG
jgi:hypothetical protein